MFNHPIFQLVLIVLGLWVAFEYIIPKLSSPFDTIAKVVVGVLALVWLLGFIGLI